LTPLNYQQLQQLYTSLLPHKFTILAFPCNQFARQEPGTNQEIKEFATQTHGATFPLFAKIFVNGPKTHPIFKFLKAQQGGLLGSTIKWNFTKFVVDREGRPVRRYAPNMKPVEMTDYLMQLLTNS